MDVLVALGFQVLVLQHKFNRKPNPKRHQSDTLRTTTTKSDFALNPKPYEVEPKGAEQPSTPKP